MTKKSKFGGVPLEDNAPLDDKESKDEKKRGFFINSSGWLFSFSFMFLFIGAAFYENDWVFEDDNHKILVQQQNEKAEDAREDWYGSRNAPNRSFNASIPHLWQFKKGSNIVVTPEYLCKTKAKLESEPYFELELQPGDVIDVYHKSRSYSYEVDKVQYKPIGTLNQDSGYTHGPFSPNNLNKFNGSPCSGKWKGKAASFVLGIESVVLTEPADFDADKLVVQRVKKSAISQLNAVPDNDYPAPALFFGSRLLEGYYMPIFYFSWEDRMPLSEMRVGYYFLPTSIQGTIFLVIFLVLFTIALRGNFKSSGLVLGLIQSILQILVFVPFSAYLILILLVMAWGGASAASKAAKKVAKSPGASAGIGAFLGASLGKKETRGKPKKSKNKNPLEKWISGKNK